MAAFGHVATPTEIPSPTIRAAPEYQRDTAHSDRLKCSSHRDRRGLHAIGVQDDVGSIKDADDVIKLGGIQVGIIDSDIMLPHSC